MANISGAFSCVSNSSCWSLNMTPAAAPCHEGCDFLPQNIRAAEVDHCMCLYNEIVKNRMRTKLNKC